MKNSKKQKQAVSGSYSDDPSMEQELVVVIQ